MEVEKVDGGEADVVLHAPQCTIYVNNLNEKIKHKELVESLTEFFGGFGEVIALCPSSCLAEQSALDLVTKSSADTSSAVRFFRLLR